MDCLLFFGRVYLDNFEKPMLWLYRSTFYRNIPFFVDKIVACRFDGNILTTMREIFGDHFCVRDFVVALYKFSARWKLQFPQLLDYIDERWQMAVIYQYLQ